MPELLYVLAVLACPIGMGIMMLVMMRGHPRHGAPSSPDQTADEVARLRAEVAQLRAEQSDQSGRTPPERR